MMIPQLADFADDAFVGAHCFRYMGMETIEGRRVLRVDVDPVKSLREPDVRGSLYLDATSHSIRRTTLYLETPWGPQSAKEILGTRIDTWFSDVIASIPVMDSVKATMIVRDAFTKMRRANRAATESQRRIEMRFWIGAPKLQENRDHSIARLRATGLFELTR